MGNVQRRAYRAFNAVTQKERRGLSVQRLRGLTGITDQAIEAINRFGIGAQLSNGWRVEIDEAFENLEVTALERTWGTGWVGWFSDEWREMQALFGVMG